MSPNLSALFDGLSTRDFERVLAYLQNAAAVAEHYAGRPAEGEQLRAEAIGLREALITAIIDGHPADQYALTNIEKDSCARFLLRFENIFTTNYDLLLYWVLVRLINGKTVRYDRFTDCFFKRDDD